RARRPRLVVGDLATQRATRRMRLPPLSVGAVRELVGQRDVDAAELHRITGGNPFYVSEILEAGWPSVPPTVRDVVGARLARASAGTGERWSPRPLSARAWSRPCWPGSWRTRGRRPARASRPGSSVP